LVLTGTFLVVEVIAGLWTGSLALLADAGHMLTDVAGLGLALFAIWFASKPATPEKSYGYYRVEILAALANSLLLLGIAAFILYEAYRRFLAPPDVLGVPMIVVAVIGLAVNAAGMWLLRRGAGESLNVRGAYMEVVSDALGSVGVLVAGIVILTTGWRPADPLIAAAVGVFIVPRTWALIKQSVDVLLEATPEHIDLTEVASAMRAVGGVRKVHDLHVWTLTSGKYAMSGHVVVEDIGASDRVLRDLHALLHGRFDIDHTTIQLETEPLLQITSSHPDERPAPDRENLR
jgi:cobalt-zinc-cadmium efflux system protein